MSKRIVCVHPAAVFSPAVDIANGYSALYGEEIEVDSEHAGHPPKGNPGDEGFDAGSGMLALTDVWQPSTTNAAKEAAAEGKKLRKGTDVTSEPAPAAADEEKA